MNRCKTSTNTLTLLALCAASFFSLQASAQDYTPRPQTQNEFQAGGRTFPVGTLRGKFMVVDGTNVILDGNAEQLSPGARIRTDQNLQVMTGSIIGQKLLVNYTRDASGRLREVWILTRDEAGMGREAASTPFLNFWPFVQNDTLNTQ